MEILLVIQQNILISKYSNSYANSIIETRLNESENICTIFIFLIKRCFLNE